MRITNFIRNLVGQGEVVASWGEAKLVKHLDGKLELRGGSKEDRGEARDGSRCFGMRRWWGMCNSGLRALTRVYRSPTLPSVP